MVRIDKNFKNFLIKVVIAIALIFLSRVLFQFPVEYYKLALFKQNDLTRLFSKIDALQVVTLLSILFGLYYKERISKLDHPKPEWLKSIMLLVSAELTIAVYYLIRALDNAFSISSGLQLYLIQLSLLISLGLAFLLFLLAVFSWEYLKSFFKEFKKEIIIFAIIAVVLYNALMTFQKQWLFFSSGVTIILSIILSLFFPVTTAMNASGGPILRAADFGVSIGPPCSGIDSMLLFFAFFAALFALDRKIVRKGLYVLFFIIGLMGVYIINVLRLFLLMLAGIYISPRFAVGLFHTNAGWVLFVLYFLLYYWFIRKFIYKKDVPKSADRKEKDKTIAESIK